MTYVVNTHKISNDCHVYVLCEVSNTCTSYSSDADADAASCLQIRLAGRDASIAIMLRMREMMQRMMM